MLLCLTIVACLLINVYCESVAFSVNYKSGLSGSPIVNSDQFFTSSPSAQQIADICARISGLKPILWEEKMNLPARSLSDSMVEQPILLEVHGGALPESVQPVIRTSPASPLSNSPSIEEVVQELQANGIVPISNTLKSDGAGEVQQYLSRYADRPVIIFHHESQSTLQFDQHRALESTSNSTVPTLTEQQISQYQICLWTGLVFVLLIIASVCSIVNMEVIPDSLLYAKFQSGRTEGKRD